MPLKPEPQPECPYEETNTWDNYKNAVWLGLLMAAATLATVFQFLLQLPVFYLNVLVVFHGIFRQKRGD